MAEEHEIDEVELEELEDRENPNIMWTSIPGDL